MSSLQQAIKFGKTGNYESGEQIFRAPDRAAVSGRLINWAKIFQRYTDSSRSYFLTAVIGEVSNNCFDHNLGRWIDEPGCLITFDFGSDRIRMCVVDRGQGVVSSLRTAVAGVHDDQSILAMAFEKVLSGRAPERRGNGLKFVTKTFANSGGRELVCLSAGAAYRLGHPYENSLQAQMPASADIPGTLIAIDWSI